MKSSDTLNPYATPQSDLQLANPEQLQLAKTSQRFWTNIIDTLVIYVLAVLVGILLALFDAIEIFDSIPDLVFGWALMLIYYIPQEALFGKTLGKLIMGTQVVCEDGTKLTFGKAVGRSFCRLIPFEAFSLLAGSDGRPKGWHDTIPKTKVLTLR